METRAWVWNGSLVPELTSLELPELREYDVMVKVRSIGICATDLHIMNRSVSFAEPPYALGHEAAGEVVRVGAGVTRIQVGERCALDPSVGCGSCDVCLAGDKHQCAHSGEYGLNRSGFWQEHVIVSEKNVYVLPESIGFDEASQAETIHVCLGGMDKVRLRAGETAIIIGDGPTGLFFARLCKIMGVSRLTVAGTRPRRLELALAYGADEAINIIEQDLLSVAVQQSYDVVIEAVGKPETIQLAQRFVANRGRVLLFGLPARKVEVDVLDLILREVTCIGSANAPQVWPRVIALLASGSIDVKPMITNRYPYEQLDQAINCAMSGGDETIKVIVDN
ncbi:zinc-dependent alcohol dehydrogenase [Cohnella rhizosphaerae]|uniref:Alcohol dehydrogenase catalytic domain-containing protein n=1 Tax=Cohnella rhizosphaerae TaxID=1457232 RepID=A0A9X4KXU3_9BACL|nr:alcohol dehydrogenase catalytic domain-containing protein [Cohnella rhizosphaerae]MDG0812733.1 alcohol dehydrogenase catalytic domain-containing protein [Cohnella rhizosphaerae]